MVVCLSVRPSLHPAKRITIIMQTTPQDRDSSFLMPKTLVKFWGRITSIGGAKCTGVGKICDFRQMTRCVWRTVQYRHSFYAR